MYNFYLKNCLSPHASGLRRKLLLIMKLTTLILITVILHVSAASLAQKVTLKEKNAQLTDIFNQINTQTGYDFVFTETILKGSKPVTINVQNQELKDVLTQIFQGQNLDFTLDNKIVVIKPKEESILDKIKNALAAINVTGTVVGDDGHPLAGATVQVKGGSNNTATDANGYFKLTNVDPGATLQISFIGYAKLEIAAKNNLGILKLSLSQSKLDEVKVIAYGQTTERLSAGNVSSISAKDIAEQPVNNPLLALQGRTPGVFVEQTTGVAGSGVHVRIQGQNSLNQGSDPLYVVDGVPYIGEMPLSRVQSSILGPRVAYEGTGSPFSYISPNDIESISVLKGADATSIYGSRAAAGAVLITTKKGKAGKTQVTFNAQNGFGKVAHFVDVLNTQQYLAMRHLAKANDNAAITATDYDINGSWDTTRNTNWQKTLIGGTAHYNDEQVSVSGGNALTTFLAGVGYHRETTVFRGDFDDQKYSLHVSMNHASQNNRFHLQMGVQYLVDNNHLPTTDITTKALVISPDAPALNNTNGTFNWAPNAAGNSTWFNPLAYLNATYQNNVNNLISNSVISYTILPGLDIKTNLGYTNLARNEVSIQPLTLLAPENRPTGTRTSQFGTDNVNSWIIEPQLTYTKSLGKGKLQALIGSTLQKSWSSQQDINATGFTTDLLMQDIRSASTLTPLSTGVSVYRYNALFARVNYTLDDKYILNLTGRRDGSSRFGANNQFHDFASVSGAWIFSEENFIKNHFGFLSYGKIRTSYGTTGSDQIGDYGFLNLYNSNAFPVPYQGVTGLTTASLPNPYLQWELTKKLEAGLDLGFLKDRILVNLTWYQNRSSNQLQGYALPQLTGVGSILENFPATIQNSGIEFSIYTLNIKSKTFSWNSSINFTKQNSKLLAYQNLAQSSNASYYVIGEPFVFIQTYQALGVNSTTGLFSFADSHGNPTSSPVFPTDATVRINTLPQFYGGFQNSLNYKQFSLDFLFNFVKQNALGYQFGNRPGAFNSNSFSFIYGNQPTTILDNWQKPGDNTFFQKLSTTYPVATSNSYSRITQSTASYTDASYVRLKNLSFSWNLPKSWITKAGMQNARLYVQGQNLLTFTNYIGLDPETKGAFSNASLPPLRIWTLGAQITL
jgi:TonB-linked SusC/RagA family outer membrane protein